MEGVDARGNNMSNNGLTHWLVGLTIFVAVIALTHKWSIDNNYHRSLEALERIEALEGSCND